MSILHLFIRPSEPCIFAIFKPAIFKFWILIEDYIKINEINVFFDSLSISSDIELRLGDSQIKMFYHFLRIFPITIKFRVDPMIYFGSSDH
jgi:hypothetical protein